ncbi:MAG: hypothetical protein JKY96_06365, partial [Phycisphaerales bacterium]|nr:hypothetical protein [Phycisphaerales bacterium]
ELPALLITAGIDGRHLIGTETALGVAKLILEEHREVLDSMTIYIIPRVNPDGAVRNTNSLTMGYRGNARSTDDDRDRQANEDGADDLNGDGYITMMRRLEPPIEDAATHMSDPDDPRMNIKPDTKDGQRAVFTLYTEGIDNDEDGLINEDGFGLVDLNKNFMHRWDEYAMDSGMYQLSEPESAALAEFVLGHRNIVMSITYGSHDNLVNLPDSKGKDASGRAPKGIDAGDVDLYKHASELYKEATGQKSAPKGDDAGSFHSWMYAQMGVPSFATAVWVRPEPEKDDDASEDDAETTEEADEQDDSGLHPSGIGDISQETIDELVEAYEAETGEAIDESMMSMVTPEMIVGFAAQAGVEIQRIPEEEPEAETVKDEKSKKKPKSEDAKWLAYFESAGVDGFVEWEPFDHPTLGPVEIGGFIPLSKINPPAGQLEELVTGQTAFVVSLVESRPQIEVAGPEVNKLANGLYEIRFAMINEGEMPTSTAYSQSKRTIRPVVIRMSAEVDRIVTGQRVSRVWGISANGGRSEHHWIIRTDRIENETIEIIDPRFGNRTLRIGDSL